MRIVAEVAVDRMIDTAHHVNNVGLTRELGFGMLFAEVCPIEHQVGRLAGPANRVACSGRTGTSRLLRIVFRILVVDDVPHAEGTVALTEVHPAFLRFEAAAEGAVAEILVKCGKRVAAGQIVFLREAVGTQGAIEERVRSNAGAVLLGEARNTFFVDLVHGIELRGMAGTAGLGIHARHRARILARSAHVLGKAGVAARAGNLLVSTGLVEAADVAMAGHAGLGVNFFRGCVNGRGKSHCHCKCYASLNEIMFCHLVSPNRDLSYFVWNREARLGCRSLV